MEIECWMCEWKKEDKVVKVISEILGVGLLMVIVVVVMMGDLKVFSLG